MVDIFWLAGTWGVDTRDYIFSLMFIYSCRGGGEDRGWGSVRDLIILWGKISPPLTFVSLFFTRLCAFLSSCTEQGLMVFLQRTIDGGSVWIALALVTANFCGTHCPRSTIHSSVSGHLWKVRNELRNGLESETRGPINIGVRRLSPFFPLLHLTHFPVSFFHLLLGSLCFAQHLRLWSYKEQVVARCLPWGHHFVPVWSITPLTLFFGFCYLSLKISGYKALAVHSAIFCSVLRVSTCH